MKALGDDPQLPLAGLRVGISGAVPEREFWGSTEDLDCRILSAVSRLSGFVMEYGGTIVHGSQPALAPVIAEQARDVGDVEERSAGKAAVPNPLLLVGSQLWGYLPQVTERAAQRAGAAVVLTPKLGAGDATDPPTRNASLTGMRLVMARQVDVQVAIGGKLHRKTGFHPGILEELAIMRWHGIPCFVVACFGGAAGNLESTMLHRFSDGNRLSEGEVGKIAAWSEAEDEPVGILLAHFARHRDAFLARGEVAPVRQVRFHPAQLPGLPPARIAEIDPALVEDAGKRFADLKQAVDRADSARAGELLKVAL
jgi:hypothetical protein